MTRSFFCVCVCVMFAAPHLTTVMTLAMSEFKERTSKHRDHHEKLNVEKTVHSCHRSLLKFLQKPGVNAAVSEFCQILFPAFIVFLIEEKLFLFSGN